MDSTMETTTGKKVKITNAGKIANDTGEWFVSYEPFALDKISQTIINIDRD